MQRTEQASKPVAQEKPIKPSSANSVLKPVFHAIAIFITLGITVANQMLSRLGLESNYLVVFSLAFILAAVLMGRNLLFIGLVVIGVGIINLPDVTLLRYGLDRDILLAALCAIILVPSVYQLLVK